MWNISSSFESSTRIGIASASRTTLRRRCGRRRSPSRPRRRGSMPSRRHGGGAVLGQPRQRRDRQVADPPRQAGRGLGRLAERADPADQPHAASEDFAQGDGARQWGGIPLPGARGGCDPAPAPPRTRWSKRRRLRPAHPVWLTATPLANAVRLAWTGLPAGSSAAVGWQFRYGETGQSFGAWTLHPDAGAQSLTVGDLTGGTGYEFELRAVGTAGTGAVSPVTATAGALPTALAPGATVGVTSPYLSWEDPDASEGVTHYEYRQETAGEISDWQEIAPGDISSDSGDTEFALPAGLAGATEHHFRSGGERVRSRPGWQSRPVRVPAADHRFPGDAPATAASNSPGQCGRPLRPRMKYSVHGYSGWDHVRDEGKGSILAPRDDVPFGDANTNRHTIEGLRNDRVYKVFLAVHNEWGSTETSIGNVVWAEARRAEAFGAEAGNRRVRLHWTDPQDNTILRWKLRQQAGQRGVHGTGPRSSPPAARRRVSEHILLGVWRTTPTTASNCVRSTASTPGATRRAHRPPHRGRSESSAAPTGIKVLANKAGPGPGSSTPGPRRRRKARGCGRPASAKSRAAGRRLVRRRSREHPLPHQRGYPGVRDRLLPTARRRMFPYASKSGRAAGPVPVPPRHWT